MIEIKDLSKKYGKTYAVDNLSFTVPDGKITGFLGPNGSGKTTTMKMMLELAQKTTGEVLFNGKKYSQFKSPLSEVGSLLEAKSGAKKHTCMEHLKWIAATNGIPSKRVHEVLELVGLEKAAKKKLGDLSLGMSQRLGLAVALLGNPHTLILDEPVNGLDPEGISWMRGFLGDYAKNGNTVLISSHLLREMEGFADYLVVIGKGKMIANSSMTDFIDAAGKKSTLVSSPDSIQLKTLLHDRGFEVEDTREADTFVVLDVDPIRISSLASANDILLSTLTPQKASLEQAYMSMTENITEYKAGGEN